MKRNYSLLSLRFRSSRRAGLVFPQWVTTQCNHSSWNLPAHGWSAVSRLPTRFNEPGFSLQPFLSRREIGAAILTTRHCVEVLKFNDQLHQPCCSYHWLTLGTWEKEVSSSEDGNRLSELTTTTVTSPAPESCHRLLYQQLTWGVILATISRAAVLTDGTTQLTARHKNLKTNSTQWTAVQIIHVVGRLGFCGEQFFAIISVFLVH